MSNENNTLRINAGDLPGFRLDNSAPSRTKAKNSPRRKAWEETIRTHAQVIMEKARNVAVSASEVLGALTALDLKPFPIRKANGLGDAMGTVGLNLPVIEGYGAKRYFLAALTMSAEELAALWSDKKALAEFIARKNAELQASPQGADDSTPMQQSEAA